MKGYSKVQDCIKISSDYWLRAAAARMYVYLDRVESKSNVSDDPSRLCCDELMAKLHAVWDEPNLKFLGSPFPHRNPAHWFGNQAKWQCLLRTA